LAAVIEDIAYAPAGAGGRGHLLDLYLPAGESTGLRPVLIWSSGSAWLSDDGKAGAAEVAAALVPRGWAVAGVSVRSSAQACFPGQVHDIKAAIRWLRANAADHGLDRERFATMGNSSGGWVAAMAALVGAESGMEGELGVAGEPSGVQAAVDLYGPTDFAQMDEHMIDPGFAVFNAAAGTTTGHADARSPESRLVGAAIETVPDLVAAANPARYASAGAPPLLIVHGDADPLVPHHQSELLHAALCEAGADATFVSVPGVGHEHPYLTDPAASAGRAVSSSRSRGADLDLLRAEGPTWDAVVAFLEGALATGG
jgi:acetyl esterase/lipase